MQATPKDAGTAVIIEIIGGILGFLGLGFIYAGMTTSGILRLIGWWILLFIFGLIIGITGGIAAFCLIPIALAIPIISGLMLKGKMARMQ
jgi:hypothetical protein